MLAKIHKNGRYSIAKYCSHAKRYSFNRLWRYNPVGKPTSFDPALPNNPVYSGDAYTPRMPQVFYKPSNKALNKLIDDYNDLADITGESNKIANLEFDINKAKKDHQKFLKKVLLIFLIIQMSQD